MSALLERHVESLDAAASTHRLAPLLVTHLLRTGRFGSISPSVERRLRVHAATDTATSLLLIELLQDILSNLTARGVDAIALRGPALSQELYGDPTLRPCDDLDLLVRQSDLDRVDQTLAALGFREYTHRRGFAAAFSYTLVHIRKSPGPLAIETHWTLAYPPAHRRLDMNAVWKRCVPVSDTRFGPLRLAPDDLLLHLCLHLAHRWADAPDLWLVDLDTLIRRESPALEWEQFIGTVEELGANDVVSRVFTRLQNQCGTPFPAGVLTRLRQVSRTDGLCMDMGLASREEFSQWLALMSVRDRVRYAMGLLWPTPAFMRERYGVGCRAGVAYAYGRRLFALVYEGVRAGASMLRHRFPVRVP